MKLIFFIIMLVGCEKGIELDINKTYRHDMVIEYDRREFIGTAILPEKPQYDFKFSWKTRAEILFFTTCHREMVFEFSGAKRHRLTFAPNRVEKTGYCPIKVEAVDLDGKVSFAHMVTRRDHENLDGFLNCNGENKRVKGAAICQSKRGLYQRIAFDKPVRVRSLTPECSKLETNKLGQFEFKLPHGICHYLFLDDSGSYLRLKTIGYYETIIRKHEFN